MPHCMMSDAGDSWAVTRKFSCLHWQT